MYTLYYSPGTAALVVHWLLIELDAPHRLRRLNLSEGEHKRPEYLSLNPAGVVPTLLIDDQPICEAAAIVMYLADAHPESGLAPTGDSLQRAPYYQWMCFSANTLQPAFRTWFYPAEAAGEPASAAAMEAAREKIETAWTQVDAYLASRGGYLLGGDAPSAADFMLTMLMRWSRNMPRPATDWPHLAELVRRMKARPSFAELYAREGLTEWS